MDLLPEIFHNPPWDVDADETFVTIPSTCRSLLGGGRNQKIGVGVLSLSAFSIAWLIHWAVEACTSSGIGSCPVFRSTCFGEFTQRKPLFPDGLHDIACTYCPIAAARVTCGNDSAYTSYRQMQWTRWSRKESSETTPPPTGAKLSDLCRPSHPQMFGKPPSPTRLKSTARIGQSG